MNAFDEVSKKKQASSLNNSKKWKLQDDDPLQNPMMFG